jgi:uncharacterized protein YndB with AHSA1/START domain
MRFVKIFVIANGALIVIGLVTLFAVSHRPGAGHVPGVVELDAPPAAVMPWLTEPARLRQWVGYLQQVEGDTSAAAVGRRQVWRMDDGQGGAVLLASRITAYAPPDSLRLHVEVPGLVEGDNAYVLTDLGGRTRLAVDGRYRHPNPIVALLEPMATPQAVNKLRGDLARLRAQVAAEARAGAAPDSPGAHAAE